MKAAYTPIYGTPNVIELREIGAPIPTAPPQPRAPGRCPRVRRSAG